MMGDGDGKMLAKMPIGRSKLNAGIKMKSISLFISALASATFAKTTADVGLTSENFSQYLKDLESEFLDVNSAPLPPDGLLSLSPGFRPKVKTDPAPIDGFFDVANIKYKNPLMDKSNQHITVFYPVNFDVNTTNSFRFIAYAHGYLGGGVQTGPSYYEMCKALASFGYVVALPHACDVGCVSDGEPGFHHYYFEQLKAIDWAREMWLSGEDGFANLDLDDGVGIAGHSMGGQATLFSSAYNATEFNIKAAVYHEAATSTFPTPEIPHLIVTAEYDDEAVPEKDAQPIFDLDTPEWMSKGIFNKAGFGHHQPDILGWNRLLPQFTVAWMKIFLDGVMSENGVDWEEMIFGTGEKSICTGGGGSVIEDMCQMVDKRAVAVDIDN